MMNPQNLQYSFMFEAATSVLCIILLMNLARSLASSAPSMYDSPLMYESCKPVRCEKGPNITYPYYLDGHQNESCGYPSFKVQCYGGYPTGYSYIIKSISDYGTSATLVNSATLDKTCPVPLSIPKEEDSGEFLKLTDDIAFLCFFNNCSSPPPKNATEVSCQSSGTGIGNGTKLFVGLSSNQYCDKFSNWSGNYSSCKSLVVAPVEVKNMKQLQQLSMIDHFTKGVDYVNLLKGGFRVRMKWEEEGCKRCQSSGGRCGYDKSHTRSVCHCPDRTHLKECRSVAVKWIWKLVLVAAVVGGTILTTLAASLFIKRIRKLMFWNRPSKEHQDMENFIRNYGSLTPKRFKYSEVKKMTNSFKEKLGQGGFGAVYKGKLLGDETLVAVKLLHESKGNGEDFINEVASISRTSHVNIVTLIGFCLEGSKRGLIYEYMPNQSLDKFICGEGPERHLGLEKLHQIAVGIARGLEYLHRGCNTRILHFDIKPQNILLDDDFCPKISDFGLSKLCLKKESIVSTLTTRGTIGYIAPEVFSRNFGRVSHKSDVYSYGMMLIDMVGGRRKLKEEGEQSSEVYFPDPVYRLLEQDNTNALGLDGPVTPEENEISRKMIAVGLWCIQTVPSHRPSMSRVIELLEGSIETLQMPPKPCLFSPSRSLTQESFSTLESL